MSLRPWSYTARIMQKFSEFSDSNECFPWSAFAEELVMQLPIYIDARDLGSPPDWITRVSDACALIRTDICRVAALTQTCTWIGEVLGLNLHESYYVLADSFAYARVKVLGLPRLPYRKLHVDYNAVPLLSNEEYATIDELCTMPPGSAKQWLADMIHKGISFSFVTENELDNNKLLQELNTIFKPARLKFKLQSTIDMQLFDKPVSHKLECIE